MRVESRRFRAFQVRQFVASTLSRVLASALAVTPCATGYEPKPKYRPSSLLSSQPIRSATTSSPCGDPQQLSPRPLPSREAFSSSLT